MDEILFFSIAERLSLVFVAPDAVAGHAMKYLISIRWFESTYEVPSHQQHLYPGNPITKTTVASIQICHFRIDSQEAGRITWPPAITQLIDSERIRLSHDANVTWTTIFNIEKYPDVEPILTILTDVLASLESAGISPHDRICINCEMREAAAPTFDGSRVSQLCAKCDEQVAISVRLAETTTPEARTAIAVAAPVAVLASAIAWAVTWTVYNWFFDLVAGGKKVIPVPHIVELAIMAAIAAPAALPIGFLFRRIRGIGRTTARRLGAMCCLLGLILGEALFLYMGLRQDGLLVSASELPGAMFQFRILSGAHGIIRGLVAALAILIAYEFSTPVSARSTATAG